MEGKIINIQITGLDAGVLELLLIVQGAVMGVQAFLYKKRGDVREQFGKFIKKKRP